LSDYRTIARYWGKHKGEDIFVVGYGTSLFDFDLTRIKEFTVIAINSAIEPFFKIKGAGKRYHIFADSALSKEYKDFDYPPDYIITCQAKGEEELIRHGIHPKKIQPFAKSSNAQVKAKDDAIYICHTTATGAIEMAWKMGAERIFLLGVDAYCWGEEETSKYYADGTPDPKKRKVIERFPDGRVIQRRHQEYKVEMKRVRDFFDSIGEYQDKWPGSNVYNLSPLSYIDAWEKVSV